MITRHASGTLLLAANQAIRSNYARMGGLGAAVLFLLNEVPEQYTFYAAVLVLSCSIASALVTPPHAGSGWAVAYQVITTIGLNIGWAENHFKPGQSGVRVPLADKPAAKQAVAAAGIPVLNSKGRAETPAR
ncbi:hypothetical protein CFR76_04575 [Komagataeibacter swingsii]|uniref:Uncharacterized protein n=2 Tax=Komagataeibacter swingsii TaxID=215220 RepID=A0A2V4SFC8_9PROT|nr:hypothetical protein CFR76_04575 [Komagataeibacter swingsii]GBQ58844.1 hypothetical protein AA16373_1381 [Komagataeibacter swingsii DSM 16373]